MKDRGMGDRSGNEVVRKENLDNLALDVSMARLRLEELGKLVLIHSCIGSDVSNAFGHLGKDVEE
jgi:hypothetical protein